MGIRVVYQVAHKYDERRKMIEVCFILGIILVLAVLISSLESLRKKD